MLARMHSADEVLELCNRVAVLDRGRLLATGTTTSLVKDLGEERYALFTRDASHPALAALGAARRGRSVDDAWRRGRMEAH